VSPFAPQKKRTFAERKAILWQTILGQFLREIAVRKMASTLARIARLAVPLTSVALAAAGFVPAGLNRFNATAAPVSAPAHVTIYDPDPRHLWNRLHRALWVRTGPDGKEYGHDRLDPLLRKETKHLLEGESHAQAIAVLDEFLAARGEKLVNDPLKRAVLQRDLCALRKREEYSRGLLHGLWEDQPAR
jgi:hypothetical protein